MTLTCLLNTNSTSQTAQYEDRPKRSPLCKASPTSLYHKPTVLTRKRLPCEYVCQERSPQVCKNCITAICVCLFHGKSEEHKDTRVTHIFVCVCLRALWVKKSWPEAAAVVIVFVRRSWVFRTLLSSPSQRGSNTFTCTHLRHVMLTQITHKLHLDVTENSF